MEALQQFFDVSPGPELVNPMFGRPHFVAIALLGATVVGMWWGRDRLRALDFDGPVVRGLSWFMLIDQLVLHALYFVYDYEPTWERFPLHLCSWLSFFLPVMTLLGRIDAIRYVGIWAMGSGSMAILNMSLPYNPIASYVFLHYVWMHIYLATFPIFLAIRGDMRMSYAEFLASMGGLVALSTVVFGIDWLLDTDYMYLGPSSNLEIPFIPADWRAWPWSFPTFTVIGVLLFHVFYLALRPVAYAEDRS